MRTLTIVTICLLSVVLFHCHSGRGKSTTVSDGNTTVEISENERMYKLEANFNKNKVEDVYQYINASLKPNSLFTSEDDRVDISMTLGDGTTFQLKAHRGELSLTFDKRSNSREAYKRIRGLCEGVKEIVL
jgi:hypothetical protein